MPSIPEDEIIDKLIQHGVCPTPKRKDCQDCQRRIKEAKQAIRQYAAKARIDEASKAKSKLASMTSNSRLLDYLERRIKQLKEEQ